MTFFPDTGLRGKIMFEHLRVIDDESILRLCMDLYGVILWTTSHETAKLHHLVFFLGK